MKGEGGKMIAESCCALLGMEDSFACSEGRLISRNFPTMCVNVLDLMGDWADDSVLIAF